MVPTDLTDGTLPVLGDRRDETEHQRQWDTMIVVYRVQFYMTQKHRFQELLADGQGHRELWKSDLEWRSMLTVLRKVFPVQECGVRRQEHAQCAEKSFHTSGMQVFQMADQRVKRTEECAWLCVA